MVKDHIILALAWILFGVAHSVLASPRVKRSGMGKFFPRYRTLYVLFALVACAGIIFFQAIITTKYIFQPVSILRVAGIIIAAGGIVIMAISIRKYFPRFSGLWKEEKDILFSDGLNRYVRHPLYLGTFCFLWGWFLATPYWSLLISNSIITCYTLIGIHFEEKKLEATFGESYTAYKKKVPKIIPTFR
jgi:methanethiol S-methyltransferase